jgi:hypothetical protein
VEIARRYANRGEATADLHKTARKLAKAAGKREPTADQTNRPGQAPRVVDRLGPDVIAQLVAEYQAGEPSTTLTTRYGVGKGTVLRLLREHSVTVRQPPTQDADAAQAIELYQQGWSLARVGQKLNRDPATIRNILIRAGIPRRDAHGHDR